MKKGLGFSLFSLILVILILGGSASAQGDNSIYFTIYYSNANVSGAPDQTVRVINDGDTGQNLWASFYVFDDSQEMEACCSCKVTPDGLLSESVNGDLTSNTLTARPDKQGVIEVISSSVQATGPANFFNQSDFKNVPTPGLRVWSTHTQRSHAGYNVSESLAADSNLTMPQEDMLETLCLFVNLLGGTQGSCNCTPEGSDF